MIRSIALVWIFAFSLAGCVPSGTESAPAAGVGIRPEAVVPPVSAQPVPVEASAAVLGRQPVAWADPSNLFANASFEAGREPWYAMVAPERPWWMDFEVTDRIRHSGEYSAAFHLHAQGSIPKGVRVWGVVRDLTPERFPKRLGGWYRVEDWSRGAEAQYVQVVIMAKVEPGQFPQLRAPLVQVAYVLTGVDFRPLRISNRKFIFAGPKRPVQGKWIPFDFDLHADFKREWGAVPERYEWIRVLYEARFDHYRPGAKSEVRATVYYDDLYLGDGPSS